LTPCTNIFFRRQLALGCWFFYFYF
jgi:hypothetical protein